MWLILNKSGTRALPFDSMLSFSIDDASEVVSIPIENGSFAAYNKVDSPLSISVSLARQGSPADIDDFLTSLRDLKNSTELVSLQTPEAFYDDLNIESFSYSRSSETGAFVVDLQLVEIRQVDTQTTTTEYTRPSVKNPESASTEDNGKTGTDRPSRSILKGILG